jgi:hypothetical protein
MRKSIAQGLDEYFSKLVVFYFSSILGRRYFVTYREAKGYLESCGWENIESFFPQPIDIGRELSEVLQERGGWYELPTSLSVGIDSNDRVLVRFYPAPSDVPGMS